MADVTISLKISDANISKVCAGFLEVHPMPQENGEDKYWSVEDWITIQMESQLVTFVNQGLKLLAKENLEQITSLY